mgnify:CR=1 FL=1
MPSAGAFSLHQIPVPELVRRLSGGLSHPVHSGGRFAPLRQTLPRGSPGSGSASLN